MTHQKIRWKVIGKGAEPENVEPVKHPSVFGFHFQADYPLDKFKVSLENFTNKYRGWKSFFFDHFDNLTCDFTFQTPEVLILMRWNSSEVTVPGFSHQSLKMHETLILIQT